jgi:hypothetical protein
MAHAVRIFMSSSHRFRFVKSAEAPARKTVP